MPERGFHHSEIIRAIAAGVFVFVGSYVALIVILLVQAALFGLLQSGG